MAGLVMKQGKVDVVDVGADRIAAERGCGEQDRDVLSRGAGEARMGFRLLWRASSNTFDLNLASGDLIPIEERAGRRLRRGLDVGRGRRG